MPAYKDKKRGTWYANFYYQDWTGERKHKCKRGFKTQREAKEYERNFLDQQSKSSDILFSNLIENYLEDMAHRLKPTTIENKRYLIEGKLLPYFGKLKICDIDTITVRNWQNMLLNATDEQGRPYSQTYLKTINNQLSAALNYAIKHYRLAFDILFYTGMRSEELLALTPADRAPGPLIPFRPRKLKAYPAICRTWSPLTLTTSAGCLTLLFHKCRPRVSKS